MVSVELTAEQVYRDLCPPLVAAAARLRDRRRSRQEEIGHPAADALPPGCRDQGPESLERSGRLLHVRSAHASEQRGVFVLLFSRDAGGDAGVPCRDVPCGSRRASWEDGDGAGVLWGRKEEGLRWILSLWRILHHLPRGKVCLRSDPRGVNGEDHVSKSRSGAGTGTGKSMMIMRMW